MLWCVQELPDELQAFIFGGEGRRDYHAAAKDLIDLVFAELDVLGAPLARLCPPPPPPPGVCEALDSSLRDFRGHSGFAPAVAGGEGAPRARRPVVIRGGGCGEAGPSCGARTAFMAFNALGHCVKYDCQAASALVQVHPRPFHAVRSPLYTPHPLQSGRSRRDLCQFFASSRVSATARTQAAVCVRRPVLPAPLEHRLHC